MSRHFEEHSLNNQYQVSCLDYDGAVILFFSPLIKTSNLPSSMNVAARPRKPNFEPDSDVINYQGKKPMTDFNKNMSRWI